MSLNNARQNDILILMPSETVDVSEVIRLYESGLKQSEIAELLGRCQAGISLIMKRNGIPTRPKGPGRRWRVNEDYFSDVTTSEQAYWLGFLATDGYIIRKASVGVDVGFGLYLKASDAGHLEKLARCLESDTPVRFLAREDRTISDAGKERLVRGGGAARVQFFSMRFPADLARYNIVHAKTATCRPWEAPLELAPHYWRGAVDGDGHVSAKGEVLFVGTEAMCEGFAAFARAACGTRAKVRPLAGKRLWEFRASGGQQMRLLLPALYGGDVLALDRKKQVADAWLAANPSAPLKANCTVCGAEYARTPKNRLRYYCGGACRSRAYRLRSQRAA